MYKKLFFAMLLMPILAQADWFGEAISVKCTKPLGYFAIQQETYRGKTAAYAKEKKLQASLQPYGIYIDAAKGSCELGKEKILWEISSPNFSVSLTLDGKKIVDAIPLGFDYRGNVTGFSYTSEYKEDVSEFSVLGEWMKFEKNTPTLPETISKEWLHEKFKKCADKILCETKAIFEIPVPQKSVEETR